MMLFMKGRKAVPIGTRVMLPGGKYYREKTAQGWKHVKVERKQKAPEEESKKRTRKDDQDEPEKKAEEQQPDDGDNADSGDKDMGADGGAQDSAQAAKAEPKKRGRKPGQKNVSDLFKTEDLTVKRLLEDRRKAAVSTLDSILTSKTYVEDYGLSYTVGENGLADFMTDMMKSEGLEAGSLDELLAKFTDYNNIKFRDTRAGMNNLRLKSEKDYQDMSQKTSTVDKEYADVITKNKYVDALYRYLSDAANIDALDASDIAYSSTRVEAFYTGGGRLTVTLSGPDRWTTKRLYVEIPYSQIRSFADHYMKGAGKARFIKAVKLSSGYSEWMASRDKSMKRVMDDFKKTTGLAVRFAETFMGFDVDPNARARRGSVKNAPKVVKKGEMKEFYNQVMDVFKELNGIMDMRKYTPPDGHKLNVVLEANQGSGIAGTYAEHNHSINISPKYKGAVVHEIGHYFWERSKDMQKEFMQWVEDSGLKDKLEKATFDVRDEPDKWRDYINDGFNTVQNEFADPLTVENIRMDLLRSGSTVDSINEDVKTFTSALGTVVSYYRNKALDGTGYYKKPLAGSKGHRADPQRHKEEKDIILNSFRNIDTRELDKLAIKAYNDYPDFQKLYGSSEEMSRAFSVVRSRLRDNLRLSTLRNLNDKLDMAYNNGLRGGGNYGSEYKDQSDYWKRDTELFARTFRGYVSMKGIGALSPGADGSSLKKLDYSTASQEEKDKYSVEYEKLYDAYGWGFSEVDPDMDMLNSNNGQLGNILRKYIGEETMKSMTRLFMLLEKGRKAVPIGTKVALPGGKYYREKTATGWKHVKVQRKEGAPEDEKKDNKKEIEADKDKDEDKGQEPEKKEVSGKERVVNGLAAGTEVTVAGMQKHATIVTKHRDGTVTVKYGKNNKTKRIKISKVTAVQAATDPVKIDKAIKSATEATRTSVDAAVNGGQVGVEPKIVKYEFKPTKVKVVVPNNGSIQSNTSSPDIDCDDYSSAEPVKVNLITEKSAMNDPRPSYIPEIMEGVFQSFGGRMVATKLADGNYLMVTGKTSGYGSGEYSARSVIAGKTYAKVSLAVLCATQDYYSKKYKGIAKQKEKQALDEAVKKLDDAADLLEDFMKNPDKYKKTAALGFDERYLNRLRDIAYDKTARNRYLKNATRGMRFKTIGSNQMHSTEQGLHSVFSELKSKSGRVDSWAAHSQLMEEMKIKMNDMSVQFDENFSVYHKGEETSYGNKGLKKNLLETHGVMVKRQNGDEITGAEIKQVQVALDSVFGVFGNRSEMAKKFGLKISHSGNVGMHARKAIGIYFPHFKAIGVSFSNGGGLTLAHEWAHFMDNYVGTSKGHHYSSDDWNSSSGKMASALRKGLKGTSDYANRTCECFARSMESYYAYKSGGEDAAKALHADYTEKYYPADMEYMKKEVYPLCEQFLKEHDQTLKSMKVRLFMMQKSKLSESMEHSGKYKGGKKTWTKEQEDDGTRVEMEHTDDKDVAREIAMDHLSEDSEYYNKLRKMEGEDK
jgi:hypothetical protein